MIASSELVLRPLQSNDARQLCEAVVESLEHLLPWMPWCHAEYSEDDSHKWIDAQVKAFGAGAEYAFGIFRLDGRLVGTCGLNHLAPENRFANLGYWVRSSATGTGTASKAARMLSTWAFHERDFERLEILIAVDNVRSRRVAEKVGATFEGILRSRLRLREKMHDAAVYSIIRSDVDPRATASDPATGWADQHAVGRSGSSVTGVG